MSVAGVGADLEARIMRFSNRIDKTGLTSYYNVTLKWTPEVGSASLPPPGLPPGALPLDPDAPNLFTGVQEQLGLTNYHCRSRAASPHRI